MGYVDNIDKFFMEDNKYDKYVNKSERQALVRLSLANIKKQEKKKEKKEALPKKLIPEIDKLCCTIYSSLSAKEIESNMRLTRQKIEDKYSAEDAIS